MTAPAHTRFVGYRQQKMDSAKRQDLVIHGGQQSCDVLPFSPPPPVRGHYTPKAVSREKVEKLGGVAHSSPSTRLWVGMFWHSIPVARHDCRAALSDGGSEVQSCKSKLCQNGERTADPKRHESGRAQLLGPGDAVAPRNAVESGLRFNFADAAIRLVQGGLGSVAANRSSGRMPHSAPIDRLMIIPTPHRGFEGQRSDVWIRRWWTHVDTDCCKLTARLRQPSVPRRPMSKEASSMPVCCKEPTAYASGATTPGSSRWPSADKGTSPPPYAAVTNALACPCPPRKYIVESRDRFDKPASPGRS